jgi:hypothetical protein
MHSSSPSLALATGAPSDLLLLTLLFHGGDNASSIFYLLLLTDLLLHFS